MIETLDRLRDDEARQLELAVGSGIEAERAEALLHRSGGNPFFLEELMRARDSTATTLPETIHEVLLARIDGLPPDARNLLGVAAVIGMEFGERVLRRSSPPSI